MREASRVAVLVVGVGEVPSALVGAAEQVLGPLEGVRALCFELAGGAEGIFERLREGVEAMNQGKGVLILADLCGSTLANAAFRLASQRPDCEVLCGTNLPMLMKLFSVDRRRLDARGLGEALADTGRRAINLCSDRCCGADMGRPAMAEGEVHK